MPSWEFFEKQSQEYRDIVLPPSVTASIAVEQGATLGWERYIGLNGQIIGMHTFGASTPFKDLQKKLGFMVSRIVDAVKKETGK